MAECAARDDGRDDGGRGKWYSDSRSEADSTDPLPGSCLVPNDGFSHATLLAYKYVIFIVRDSILTRSLK